MITTSRLNLLTFTAQAYQAVIKEDLETLSDLMDAEKPIQWLTNDDIVSTIRDSYEAFIDAGGTSIWNMFLYTSKMSKKLIGVGGFKNGPDDSGLVEIVYEILPSFKNMGLASEAASALIDYAFDHDAKGIKAHTTPTEDASIHVLRKLGMTYIRNIPAPSGDEVWRWELLK